MTVKALMPVRHVNLVAPLAHKATDKHITGTAAIVRDRSGAAFDLIGESLRVDGLESATSTRPTPGIATSTTATRTTTTRATSARRLPSADTHLFSLLTEAYLDCRRTKRNSASALAFEAHLESNLCELHEDLVSGAYRPGRSTCFVTLRPKPREIWAAGFRDRVVHHLLHNRISPRFYRSFTADSCACIPGRGTLYAAQRLEAQARSITENWSRPASYLKCDLSNFFVAIDKRILREQLLPRIDGAWWQALAETVLFHDPRTDVDVRSPAHVMRLVPPHKSLFNAPPNTGLPIGNLSSQFFANVYLDALDQFAKHQLRAPHYVRYVDDFVLLHESTEMLAGWHARVAAFLPEQLRAHLNPRKTVLQPIARGIDFVGHVIRPWHRTPRANALPTPCDESAMVMSTSSTRSTATSACCGSRRRAATSAPNSRTPPGAAASASKPRSPRCAASARPSPPHRRASMVKMTEVKNSSAIGAHGYDAATRILAVHFKNAKKVYHYHDVSPEEAERFAKAPSLGEHHSEHLKGKYHHTSVDA